MRDLLIPTGRESLGKLEQPQFRVVALTDSAGRSGLLLTMSHVLADGYTFYSILRQLDVAQPIVALDARRVEEARTAMDTAFNAQWMRSIPTVLGLVVGVLRNAIVSKLATPTHVCRFSAMDGAAVESVKQEAMARLALSSSSSPSSTTDSVPYISSYDVIASRFLSVAAQPTNMVAFNCRNRITGVTSAMAGNHEAVMLYPLSDVQQPEQIRRSVLVLRCESGKLPATWATLSGFGLVSDWASFYHHVDCFAGLRLIAHLPLFAPLALNVGAACVLFQVSERERAVMTNMPTALDATWQREARIITAPTSHGDSA